MLDLLIFLYCSAIEVSIPTPVAWWEAVTRICAVLAPDSPSPVYQQDPLHLVAMFHRQHDHHGFNLNDVLAVMDPEADMGRSVWGPPVWRMIHSLASGPRFGLVPDFITQLVLTIPCQQCRARLGEHVDETCGHPDTQEGMYRYTVDLHNAVNVSTGKPIFTVHE